VHCTLGFLLGAFNGAILANTLAGDGIFGQLNGNLPCTTLLSGSLGNTTCGDRRSSSSISNIGVCGLRNALRVSSEI
jgi:hypothetical protein